jgi:hypothetical protein
MMRGERLHVLTVDKSPLVPSLYSATDVDAERSSAAAGKW